MSNYTSILTRSLKRTSFLASFAKGTSVDFCFVVFLQKNFSLRTFSILQTFLFYNLFIKMIFAILPLYFVL